MNGIALPVIKIGNKVINLLNLCYWEELQGTNGDKLIEIVYPGPTCCCLSASESEEFREKMDRSQSRSSIITAPAMPGLAG